MKLNHDFFFFVIWYDTIHNCILLIHTKFTICMASYLKLSIRTISKFGDNNVYLFTQFIKFLDDRIPI